MSEVFFMQLGFLEEVLALQSVSIVTPVIDMSKDEIVKMAVSLNAPLINSYSCYARGDKACGVCDSCALRLRGFEKAGFDDPIEYDQRPTYLK